MSKARSLSWAGRGQTLRPTGVGACHSRNSIRRGAQCIDDSYRATRI